MSWMRATTGIAGLLTMLALTSPPDAGAQDEEMDVNPSDVRAVASRGTAPRVTGAGTGTISMDLVDAGLDDVLKLLSQQAGLNFVAAQAVRDKRVTVYMDRVPVQTAIQSLLDANTLTFHRIEHSDVFIVTESGGRPVRIMTKVYTLKFARVLPTISESVATFGATGSLIQSGFGGTTGTGAGTTGSSTGAGTGYGGGGGISGGAGGAGRAENQGVVAIIKQLLTERGTISTDPRTNSVAVSDIPETFPIIEATLAKLDVKPTQIFLEAEVLEVTLDTLRRLGIEYGDATTGAFATFTGPSRQTDFPLGPTLLKRAATPTHTLGTLNLSNITATLKALATEKDVKFLASPRLMTLSNEVAEIRIVTDAVTGTTSISQTQTGTISTQIERSSVGTILRITPLVTEGRYITMVIEPEVSRVVESAKFSSFLDPTRRAARTTVMVEDGGTVLIAGLLSRERELSRRKVPFLGDIPILGAPFRRTATTDTETEIIVFITPRVVPDAAAPRVTREIPVREQTPLSAREQTAYRRYREELLNRRRFQDVLDPLAHP